MDELIDQLTVSAMNFDSVKSGFHHILSRLRELANQVPYLFVGQLSGRPMVCIDGYCADPYHVNHILAGSSATRAENLTKNEAAIGVHTLNNPFPLGDLSI